MDQRLTANEVVSLARHPKEQEAATELEAWFVAEDGFREYFEDFEEEAAHPDLYGKRVLVTRRQNRALIAFIDDVAETLGIEPPPCFLHASYTQVCDSEGCARPRLELSARALETFHEAELQHLVAKEMFHIRAGHLRYELMAEKMLGLLNAIPNLPGLNLLKQFGTDYAFDAMTVKLRRAAFRWFRYACFSAERFAIAKVGNVDASIRATLLTVLGERALAEAVEPADLVHQAAHIETMLSPFAVLGRLDEVIPYAPHRVMNMLRFLHEPAGRRLFVQLGAG